MKKFATIISILLCLSLMLSVLSLVSCNAEDDHDHDNDETAAPVDDSTVLNVGVVLSDAPYIYQKDDKVVGICVDLLSNIATYHNYTLEIEIVKDRATLAAGVKDGTYEAALLESNYAIASDVRDYLIFTDGFATNHQAVVVKSGSTIKTVDELDGKKVAVKSGTSTEEDVKAKYGDNAVAYATNEEAFNAVKSGTVDAFVADIVAVEAYGISENGITILNEEFSYDLYTLYLFTENVQLRSEINTAINGIGSGVIASSIYNRYILDPVTKN